MIAIRKSFLVAAFIISTCCTAAMAQPGGQDRSMAITTQEAPSLQGATMGTIGPQADYAPQLQGATMGTIGPQGGDATMISGVMTAGTVRINNLANLEALLNILANTALVLGHLVGIYYLIKTARLAVKTPGNMLGGTAKGLTFISVGLLSPGFVNWAVAAARDAALFN